MAPRCQGRWLRRSKAYLGFGPAGTPVRMGGAGVRTTIGFEGLGREGGEGCAGTFG